ncbi:hypothetical protein KVR01_002748 [Diaporthe batatas]|uniref:uncharacterized protein n=1 Tax=Diaporthe batatas TaxID=748121 RepID=UPI001D0462D6|nr:uncharacterized protein KVR01_002748 [Diaporthe batatas]KAG8167059.1 hypothetical protein KVR01_002748 [Diaporthe batatas]
MTSLLCCHIPVQTTKSADLGNDELVTANHSIEASAPRPQTNLMDLPTELHLLISKELTYPDALSLKHTSRHFYNLVDTGVRLKVAWLMERRMLHLDCPNDRKCNLRSDLEFCRGSVTCVIYIITTLQHLSRISLTFSTNSLLIQRRREHIECESRPGLGCLVFATPQCAYRRDWRTAWRRWMKRQITVEIWWIVLAAIPLILGWLWMAELTNWAVA